MAKILSILIIAFLVVLAHPQDDPPELEPVD